MSPMPRNSLPVPTPPTRHVHPSRLRVLVAILAVLAIGSWPWVGLLTLMPQTYDAAVWVVNGLPSNPSLWEWVFRGPHFIGYRPLTALSFTLDGCLWGLNPVGHNFTNLLLHLATALAVFCTARRLAPELSPWAALLSMAVFVAHPISVEVAPQVARRSYALTTLLSLLALCTSLPPSENGVTAPCSHRHRRRAILAALAVAAATWAHEIGVVMVLVVPFASVLRARAIGLPLKNLAVPAGGVFLAGAGALAAGILAKGGIGGHATSGPLGLERFLGAVWHTPKYLLWLDSLTADVPPASVNGWAALIGVIGGIVLVGLLIRPSQLLANRQRSGCIVALAWMAALVGLYSFQGVWYGRLVYPVAAPWAILLAIAVGSPAVSAMARWGCWVLIGWLVWHSPLLVGVDSPRKLHWQAVDRVLRQAETDLNGLRESAFVRLVLPFHPPPRLVSIRDEIEPQLATPLWLRAPEVWLDARRRILGLPTIQFERFLFAEQRDATRDEMPIQYQPDPAPTLQLACNRIWHLFDRDRNAYLDTGPLGYSFPLRDLRWPDDTSSYVYIFGRPPLHVEQPAR
ncbi:MAG: hypothetical protein HZB38_00555 [Planctomycetes bacterium]|nr:hypothetical protein [Planctomycetota bacterium]